MENKQEKDRFIAIAEREDVVLSKNKPLPLVKPLEYKKTLLPSIEPVDIAIPQHSEEEQYQSFREEIKVLKDKFAPFLKELYSCPINPNETIELIDFDFRKESEEDKKDFSNILLHKGEWQQIKLPHFVGPAGKYNAVYFKNLSLDKFDNSKAYTLSFEASDYITDVYLNGRMVISHVGFFAPFEVDVTDYIHQGNNTLVILLHNENTTSGVYTNGEMNYGKKNYAATHFGYDEPKEGWHHCPAGIGVYGNLSLKITNKATIDNLYIRPNVDYSSVSGEIKIKNHDNKHLKGYYLLVSIQGRNFERTLISKEKKAIKPLQVDDNFINFEYELNGIKLWTPDTPYLYEMVVELYDENNNLIDVYHDHFGMRKFYMDMNSEPYKGQLFLNNQRIIMNGANEMGHLVLCVLRKDDEQLIEDILIAKVANLNFYRMTQRPVLRKVYDYFDMLGMMCQTDFPIFSYITDAGLNDAFSQVKDMEELVINHPSCVIDTFCNECLDAEQWGVDQYVLNRIKFEEYLNIFKSIVLAVNPDRVIKIHEGDYNPLKSNWGPSDFHCYVYWYLSHQVTFGYFNKGYLPGVKSGWMTSCGEYGVDGLDRYELLIKYAPKEWLPNSLDEPWCPKRIPKAQAWELGSDFYPEQEKILDWINASRMHQKFAIKEYVHNLRRRSDIVQSRAVHLLIDAWPAGWTKTLLDVDRIPKPAFYAFKEASIKHRVSIRSDRRSLYSDEPLSFEIFSLNDYPKQIRGTVVVSVYEDDLLAASYKKDFISEPVIQNYIGQVNYVPINKDISSLKIVAKMVDENNVETFDELSLLIRKRPQLPAKSPLFLGNSLNYMKGLFGKKIDESVIFTDAKYYQSHKDQLEHLAFEGKRIVLFTEDCLDVLNDRIGFYKHPQPGEVRATNWLERNPNSKFTEGLGVMDFQNLYDKEVDCMNVSCMYKFYWADAEPILFFRINRGNPNYQFHKEEKFAVASKKFGKGEIVVSTLSHLPGFVKYNWQVDLLIRNLFLK